MTQQVTRTERKGRYVYAVDGTEMQTARRAYPYAAVGTGNPYREDGVWMNLAMTREAAQRAAMKARREGCAMTAVTITPGDYAPAGNGLTDHPFADDGRDPGNCSVCHFVHPRAAAVTA